MNKAVFLDRDGCLNVEDDQIRNISQFRLYPQSLNSIKKLNAAGFLTIIITNQSGVARGLISEEFVVEVHKVLLRWVAEHGARIDWIEHCPHHPDGVIEKYTIECDCRKPKPGMLWRAASALDIDFSKSFVVGDKISDIELGPATGAKSVLLRTGFGENEIIKLQQSTIEYPNYIASGIGEAVEWILRTSSSSKP